MICRVILNDHGAAVRWPLRRKMLERTEGDANRAHEDNTDLEEDGGSVNRDQ